MRRSYYSSVQNIAFFIALLATALALGAALAHALELPGKIGMSRDAYFTMQRAYDGWNRLGYLLLIEILGIVSVIWLYRAVPRVAWFAALGLVFVLAAQAVFWLWTFPANQATANWTVEPGNWEQLRLVWEYSHLVGALFQTLGFIALLLAVLRRS